MPPAIGFQRPTTSGFTGISFSGIENACSFFKVSSVSRQNLSTDRCPLLGLGVAARFRLVLPTDCPALSDVVRAVIGDAEIAQVVGQMLAEDAVASPPVDVRGFGEHPHDPKLQRRLGDLPSPCGWPGWKHRAGYDSTSFLKRGSIFIVCSFEKSLPSPALVLHVLRHYAAGFITSLPAAKSLDLLNVNRPCSARLTDVMRHRPRAGGAARS